MIHSVVIDIRIDSGYFLKTQHERVAPNALLMGSRTSTHTPFLMATPSTVGGETKQNKSAHIAVMRFPSVEPLSSFSPLNEEPWAEISGGSLQRHQEEVIHVEKLMKEASLSFLWGDGGSRTATEAALASSQVSSQIRALIEGKMSAIRQVLYYRTQYTNEQLTAEAGISRNDPLVARPMEANDVA